MEAQARALSTNGGPVILVQGEHNAEMMIPAEWYRTPVGEGEFTCCRLGHKLGDTTISCDKIKVAQVLEVMFDHKQTVLLEQDKLLEWRWLKARQQTLFSDLPTRYADLQVQDIPAFLQEFRFGSIHDGEESGWTPLRFAVIRKDAELTKALIGAGSNLDSLLKNDHHHLYHQEGQSILHTAAVFGNLSVIRPLVEAGADLTPAIGG